MERMIAGRKASFREQDEKRGGVDHAPITSQCDERTALDMQYLTHQMYRVIVVHVKTADRSAAPRKTLRLTNTKRVLNRTRVICACDSDINRTIADSTIDYFAKT
jgi:hypothetical protein